MNLRDFEKLSGTFDASPKMPVLFIGHGSPMNVLYDNAFTRALHVMGEQLPRPTAILAVSAHWLTRGTHISVNPKPETIYDFGGFDDRMYQIRYEPGGHPELAREAIQLAAVKYLIHEDPGMGLDHGSWTVLKHMYPEANIPVFQLSIDYAKPASWHYEMASSLRKLREKGVLILASGNIVHNLRILDWQNIDAAPVDWAASFDTFVKKHIDSGDHQPLFDPYSFGKAAQLAVPTNDHYLPMMYTLGLADKDEPVTHLYEGFQHGSISMRCFKIGA